MAMPKLCGVFFINYYLAFDSVYYSQKIALECNPTLFLLHISKNYGKTSKQIFMCWILKKLKQTRLMQLREKFADWFQSIR